MSRFKDDCPECGYYECKCRDDEALLLPSQLSDQKGVTMFYLVDSDQFPVWLEPVDATLADASIAKGEAHAKLPASAFTLTWAVRHGQPARWYLFPR